MIFTYVIIVLQIEQSPSQTILTSLDIFFVSNYVAVHMIQGYISMIVVYFVCIFYLNSVNSSLQSVNASQARLSSLLCRSITIIRSFTDQVQFEHSRIFFQQT